MTERDKLRSERNKEVVAAIAEEEARLAALDREREESRQRLRHLRERLSDWGRRTEAPDKTAAVPGLALSFTSAEKVALFRSLFRGRADVYPKHWENTRSAKMGYAPACANEWVRGVCDKPRVKCGECPNQAFLPVADQVVLDHLQGKHIIGVYPLLEDETCWFLAADFDKRSWAEDVTAFADTCRAAGVPVAVERSRSGNGAHAWFFFAAPVSAGAARKMGCHFITTTMARRHQLSMESYDRFFPNQDTMPRGGFGNLIALPLQHEARQREHTVFLNDRLLPHSDQWAYLAGLQRIAPSTVEHIAGEATRRGLVIGVRAADLSDDEEVRTPWARPPSGRSRRQQNLGPMPSTVRAVLAQSIFVETVGLSSALINHIKRLAAFQNPEFYRKQAMRLSTALTPRVIACSREFPEHLALPRGCLSALEELLGEHGTTLSVEDQRTAGARLDVTFKGQLTATQQEAGRALLAGETGVFVAPPGLGKTVLGIFLIAERASGTLILVHRQPLLDQWVAQLSMNTRPSLLSSNDCDELGCDEDRMHGWRRPRASPANVVAVA